MTTSVRGGTTNSGILHEGSEVITYDEHGIRKGAMGYSFLHVQEEQASGTDGGTATSGSYETRVLNTSKTNNITGASLATNQVTLPAGTYYMEASAPVYDTDDSKLRIYDTTAASAIAISPTAFANSGQDADGFLITSAQVVLSVESVIEVQTRVTATKASTGLGRAATFGDVEVYASLKAWKIK